jgi:hypothetical protein
MGASTATSSRANVTSTPCASTRLRGERVELDPHHVDRERRPRHAGDEPHRAGTLPVAGRGPVAGLDPDVLDAPGARRRERAVLDDDGDLSDGEAADAHRGRRPGRWRLQQVGDVEHAALVASDANADPGERGRLDPELPPEEGARLEGDLEPVQLGERRPGPSVGQPHVGDDEPAAPQVEVEPADGERAARGRLDLPRHRPLGEARQRAPRENQRERDAQDANGGDRRTTSGHRRSSRSASSCRRPLLASTRPS